MTGQEIVDEVLCKLVDEGAEKIRKRRLLVEKLAKVRDDWNAPSQRLVSRSGAVLTLDQTRMVNANKGLELKLLVLGRHVADLVIAMDGSPARFRPRQELASNTIVVPDGELIWSKDARDGAQIRAFIDACEEHLPDGPSELQVQLQLVRRMRAGSDNEPKDPDLENLQPVMPFGYPTEIATVVDRRGDPATGNMDILARTRGSGPPNRGGDYVVLELKAPTIGTSEVSKAFRQVIGYAAALTIEANDLLSNPGADAAVAYRRLFSPPAGTAADGKGPDYSGLPLIAHAVVVLPANLAEQAQSELEKLGLSNPIIVKGHPHPISVGALLYTATKHARLDELDQPTSNNRWELSTDPGTFQWVVHQHAWRPQHRRVD